jgi:signal transduction histidine kinase
MRGRRLDAVAGVVGAVLGALSELATPGVAEGVIGGALVGASLGVMRHRPNVGFVLAVGGLALCAAAGAVSDGLFVVLMFVAFGIGRYAGRVAGVLSIVGLIAANLAPNLVDEDSWVPSIMFPLVPWGAGVALRSHAIVAERLRERAAELEQEREAYAQLSVRYERARIAAELHDIVAHAISVMVVQASAGQRIAAVDPDLTSETFRAIAGAARQAEADMGRLVTLLGDDLPDEQAPDLALVEELVSRAAGSGLEVALRLEGPLDDVPASAAATAYRVVQESLTNALRYAAGSRVVVRLRGGEDALEIEVTNGAAQAERALRDAGTGNGLAGLRERVGACGGRLQAGPLPNGGWRVAARIPRRSALPASATASPA